MSQKERPAHKIYSFSSDDPENPTKWSFGKKMLVLIAGLISISNSTISSSLPNGALPYISKEFNVSSDEQLALPISLFLIGYIFGPIVFAPLSEMYGRKAVLLPSFTVYTAFTLGCALAPSWSALLAFRFMVGVAASAPYVVIGGVFADIFETSLSRGRAITILLVFMNFGPVIGPIISAYVSPNGWRWTFWTSLIMCGVSWPLLIFLPGLNISDSVKKLSNLFTETYAPIILTERARDLRRRNPNYRVYAPAELESRTIKETLTVVLARPLRLFAEPIVFFICLFLALLFGIYYMFFEAYPIIFQDSYGLNPQIASLLYLPIGIGAALDTFVFVWYDAYIAHSKRLRRAWAFNEEYRRLPLACIGAPLYGLSLFWLGWSSKPQIPWSVPMLSGLTFGIGIELTFMALLNYLTDAYTPYAASVLASSSISRSAFAVLLPISTKALYGRLGIAWASSLLGFLALGLGLVPFVLFHYGAALRKRSKLCQSLETGSK
ncbi:MAG: hypothetical protein GOMPHAMPRED_002819 [Gomphillus americanus]|uniref:Major facilitator superfamily (MFS) profile domain-containing protein n=1 Tax=Gomphillus americanus TaxID=1940652 RepID=A0A8H3ILH7_9LECA|nr:MAG: hypothetical protein GOMPHAMPRED_002819 [Gomphillus americanus]